MPKGFRIADPEFSQTPEDMLSGEGAFLYGGRWNSPGVRIVYLGSSISQAAMELFVHLPKPKIIGQFNVMSVSFDEGQMNHVDLASLPPDWNSQSMQPVIQSVGDKWAEENVSLILQVPSIAVSGEINYLLNPTHPDMDKLIVGTINPFKYDSRMSK